MVKNNNVKRLIYLICPVRGVDAEYKSKIDDCVEYLEKLSD